MKQRTKTVLRQAAVLATSVVALVLAVGTAPQAEGATPVFVTNNVDDTVYFAQTSAICGFPVYEHDAGAVTTMVTTMPDGSVKSHDVVVKITETFYSTDPAHTGTVTARPAGPFIEIDHPDGTVTEMGIGQDGHVTMPGAGLVWGDIGITKVEVDTSGNVTEVAHGIFYPDHSGICPLL
jgi:hypothetical protein